MLQTRIGHVSSAATEDPAMDPEILLVLPAHADLTYTSSEEQHQTKLLTVTSTNLTKLIADSNADSSVVS
jgi:hypothetical protein